MNTSFHICIVGRRKVLFSILSGKVRLCVAEMQSRQALLVQLQEEAERLRAQLKQMELDKDSQLTSLREELLTQTQQLDSCQARVSDNIQ